MKHIYFSVIASFFCLLLITPILKLAHKKSWFDVPNERKVHTQQTPRLGGVGVFWSFMLALAIGLVTLFSQGEQGTLLAKYWPVLVGAALIHVIGLVDDFKDLRALLKFIVQLAVAAMVVSAGFVFKSIWIPFLDVDFQLGYLAYPLTIIWIVGVINAVNLIDGMDGLCATISGVAALTFGFLLLSHGQEFPALIAFITCGALLGYLFFNFPPASIFMGDSGSTFLGYILAVLPLMDMGATNGGVSFWNAVLLLSIPIFDTFASIIRRKKQGLSIATPDKWHLHHKLLKLGLSTRGVLNVIIPIMMVQGAVVFLSNGATRRLNGALVLTSLVVVAVLFIMLHYIKERYVRLEEKKNSLVQNHDTWDLKDKAASRT